MDYLNMEISKKKILSVLIAPVIMLFGVHALAQQGMPPVPQQQSVEEDYSVDELQTFIEANKEAAAVQQTGQGKMISAIEEEGLDVNTFNEIMSAQQNPQQEAHVSEDDLDKFDKAVEKVMEIQQDLEVEVAQAIEKTGMDVVKYEEIMLAYQSNPNLQKKVHQILNGDK